MCHHTIVVPVKPRENLWSFLNPLTYQVWIGILISMPLLILAMGLANYIFYQHMDWQNVINFVLRVALVDGRSIKSCRLNMKYQKLMAIAWMLALFVITQAYAGNLTSILTRPILRKSVKNVEDLVNQTEIKWASVDEGAEIYEYLESTPPGSTMRRLFDKAEKVVESASAHTHSPCYKIERNARNWASICDIIDIDKLKSRDYGDTGKCNYYTIDDTFFTTPAVMAFQVCVFIRMHCNPMIESLNSIDILQKESPYLEEANELLDLAGQMGLITGLYQQGLKNRTKCDKWHDIQESHIEKGKEQVITLKDTRGLFLLITIGLSAAIATFTIELLVHNRIEPRRF